MENVRKPTDECLFCVKYLFEHGYNGEDVEKMRQEATNLNTLFTLVRFEDNYWEKVAEGLREIWPTGEKDGKYPWRDSKKNIAKRLQLMWQILIPTKNYTIDQILTVARKYVAQYEMNMKFMRTLKYFILKQDRVVQPDGKIRIANSSMLANMLESEEANGTLFNSEDETIENYPNWEGELV